MRDREGEGDGERGRAKERERDREGEREREGTRDPLIGSSRIPLRSPSLVGPGFFVPAVNASPT